MKKVLIYAGTTEGRILAECLAQSGIGSTVSVATEYGEEVMPRLAGIEVRVGRLNMEQMIQLAQQEEYTAIVDATHPFAVEVSENIRTSANAIKIPYLRLQRNTEADEELSDVTRKVFGDAKACAKALEAIDGKIFLTTGSKELAIFCENEQVKERLVVRVLPGEESIRLCKEQELSGKQIVAMQGPFSKELNVALMKQYGVTCMVTKESGKTGGLDEKLQAAKECGVTVFVIGNPEVQQGLNFEQLVEELERLCGRTISTDSIVSGELRISLVGIGMGTEGTLTLRAKELLEKTDYLYGAKRMIAPYDAKVKKEPYYLSKDIIPQLKKINYNTKIIYVTILFSGDSGFYSGAGKMYQELQAAGYLQVEIVPGISSISYLSAKSGIPWQDAALFSAHGKGDIIGWKDEFLQKVKYNRYTFMLLSGGKDLRAIGALLLKEALDCMIFAGGEMSYPQESYVYLTPQEASAWSGEGLYSCVIIHENFANQKLSWHIRDDAFIRDKIPMTKDEIRALSMVKLQLERNAVVYDVGSGTGSMAIEAASHNYSIQVYAIEQNPDAVGLLRQNIEKFNLSNIEVVEGMAPKVMKELPTPTHVFIGGSKGNLKHIINQIINLKRNPEDVIRVVINAISLETIQELTDMAKEYPQMELVQVQVNKARAAGRYHLMQSENPVMIASLDL